MRYCLMLVICIWMPSLVRAQKEASVNSVKIDSIQKLLDVKPKEDSTKVITLNGLARICFYDTQFTRGLIAVRQARTLAREIGFAREEGIYLRTMAIFHRYSDLNVYYNTEAKWLYAGLSQPEPESDSSVEETSTEFNQVLPPLLAALKHFQTAEESEIAADVAYLLGAYNYQFKKPSVAAAYLEDSYKLFVKAGKETPATFTRVFKLIFLGHNEANESPERFNRVRSAIENLKDAKSKALVSYYIGILYSMQGKRPQSIEYNLRANNELEALGESYLRVLVLENLGVSFGFLAMSKKAEDFYKKALQLRKQADFHDDEARTTFNLGFELVGLRRFEEARTYFSKARGLTEKSILGTTKGAGLFRYADGMGQILMGQGKYQQALAKFQQAQQYDAQFFGNQGGNMYIKFYLAQCYQKLGKTAESIRYAEMSYEPALTSGDQRFMIKVCLLLSEVYDASGQPLQALKYLKQYRSIEKEKEEQDIANRAANLEIEGIIQKNEQEKAVLEKEKLLKEAENQNQRWWIFSIAAALFSAVVLTLLLYRNNQNKQRANAALQSQKAEIERQREKAEKALIELKATQTQLIQSEKMASLGELTAGIAHEIQNPLNFVNNYAEVNVELIEELRQEIQARDFAEIGDLATDLAENERKILHHGKQAEAIVRGMQQHSRRSSGTRELTDLNALTREYATLAYNGMSAKDKLTRDVLSLNFDPDLPRLEVIPGDLGCVILNLLNNAFYAVSEKMNVPPPGYVPAIEVATRQADEGIEIRVKDNGIGIPDDHLAKLFQPFFTTKPTGQGIGLGLSLAYDIVTKGHNGRLEVSSVETEGAEFIVYLPSQALENPLVG